MKNLNKIIISFGALILLNSSCTKLDEELYGSRYVDDGGAVSEADLNGVYTQLNGFSDQANLYALLEHPTDEMLGPTRGTDWDDFGIWRKLHQHTWDPTHGHVFEAWNQLNTGVFRATSVIERTTDNQIKAEASFLRAFFMFYIVDLYGQAPFRNPEDSPETNPRVMNRQEATDFIIEDLKFAEANLTNGTPGRATKEATQFLLAKVYLNKAVYFQDPATPAGPFTFSQEDMNQVITYSNAVINSGKFQLAGNYYDNFKWDNTTASRELIFVRENTAGESQNANAENRTRMVLHYNNTPDGWNGFTTLADFYNSYEDGDQRKYSAIDQESFTARTGLNAGFLAGQAFGPNATPLKDRSGQPLIFTPDVNINYATEAQGIRAIKYPLNPGNFSQSGNDYVFFRYADLLLMKAEAILRGGVDPMGQTPLSIVNQIRTLRNASPVTVVDLETMLAERGRELYWEGWRRNDLIRFEKFNDPVDQRPTESPATRVVFPIPQRAVDTNPNLTQNAGY
ncbi:MAG TPA: RagB/SusD family nutrient uptake outer membrane protein [Sphingobacteriaceae bacterium]